MENSVKEIEARFDKLHYPQPTQIDDLRWAIQEIERLESIVNKLPKTADGVPVVPGMTVWCCVDIPYLGGRVERELREFHVGRVGKWSFSTLNDRGYSEVSFLHCYSTKAAADAVKGVSDETL